MHRHTKAEMFFVIYFIGRSNIGEQLFPPQGISFLDNPSVSVIEGNFMFYAIHSTNTVKKKKKKASKDQRHLQIYLCSYLATFSPNITKQQKSIES